MGILLMKPGGSRDHEPLPQPSPGKYPGGVCPDQQKDTVMTELRVGDPLPVELLSFSADECPASTDTPGSENICILDQGHTGRHIAADATMTVNAAWD